MSTRSELETFLGAVRFFTRLPVPGTLGQDAPALAKAMIAVARRLFFHSE